MKFCSKCGKEIMDEAVICPNCGCAVENKAQAVQAPAVQVPKSAKQAQVFGILSVLLLYPLGIPAIVLANKSKAETNGVMCKKAKAGFVCGIIALCIWAINMLLFFGI